VIVEGRSPTAQIIRDELRNGLNGLLGTSVQLAEKVERDGAIVVTTSNSSLITGAKWKQQLNALGPEGFRIATLTVAGHSVTVIGSQGDVGALHGVFYYLRLLQTLKPIARLDVSEKPRVQLRLLDHWDNLDGTIERGYAGRSLWNWSELPQKIDPRLSDYARANASIGINGVLINNVNANAQILTDVYLGKVAALANLFRPYGIRVYLSARFSAPIELSGLKTADPLDNEVSAWWKQKADEIYRLVPDFGGFVVKANSEGQPDRGPTIAVMRTAQYVGRGGRAPITVCDRRRLRLQTGLRPRGCSICRVAAFRRKVCAECSAANQGGPATFSRANRFIRSSARCGTRSYQNFKYAGVSGFSNHLVFWR
jgi:alpha-glucuronidase